jgi:hypothetical protein
MSLTALCLAFLTVHFHEMTSRRVFRLVVLLLCATFIYDLLWLTLFRDSDAEAAEFAGKGTLIRWFATLNCWLSFFFRIVVIAVFWKVSLNYSRIIKVQS